jgi:hypothetical protein
MRSLQKQTVLKVVPLILGWIASDAGAVPAVPLNSFETRIRNQPAADQLRNPSRLGLKWEGESYFTERMPTRGRPQQQFMGLTLEAAGSAQLGWFEADGWAKGYLGFPEPQDFYSFEIIEASVGAAFVRNAETKVSIHVGRRLQDWNRLDRTWALSFMEPNFRWDLLRPSRNGLTGAFVEARHKNFSATVFGSAIAIPESGPSSTLTDGVFTSKHPQYTPAPDSAALLGVETPIRYTIEMPPISELIFKPSVGGILAYDSDGFFVTAAYQYKPAPPVLAMRHQGVFNIASGQLQPVIRPQIVQTHVLGADIGYKTKWVTPWISVMGDIPDEPKFDEAWTTQRIVPGALVAVGADSEIWDIGIKASFLQTFGGVASDVGLLSPGGFESLFGNRYPFRSAFMLSLVRPFVLAPQHKLTFAGRWVQEFSVGGTLLSSDLEYRFFERYAVGLGADLIAAESGVAASGGAGYVPGMSGYDRVRASLRFDL